MLGDCAYLCHNLEVSPQHILPCDRTLFISWEPRGTQTAGISALADTWLASCAGESLGGRCCWEGAACFSVLPR